MALRKKRKLLLPVLLIVLCSFIAMFVYTHNKGTNMINSNYLQIDENAPAAAASEITIQAKPDSVWKLLTDLKNWRSWNPDIQEMIINDPVKPGTVFKWKAGNAWITSTIQQVETPRFISWTGKMPGINAIHVWQVIPQDSVTIVKTGESWDGWLVKLLKKPMQNMLQKSLDTGLVYLKTAAEKRYPVQ